MLPLLSHYHPVNSNVIEVSRHNHHLLIQLLIPQRKLEEDLWEAPQQHQEVEQLMGSCVVWFCQIGDDNKQAAGQSLLSCLVVPNVAGLFTMKLNKHAAFRIKVVNLF